MLIVKIFAFFFGDGVLETREGIFVYFNVEVVLKAPWGGGGGGGVLTGGGGGGGGGGVLTRARVSGVEAGIQARARVLGL